MLFTDRSKKLHESTQRNDFGACTPTQTYNIPLRAFPPFGYALERLQFVFEIVKDLQIA